MGTQSLIDLAAEAPFRAGTVMLNPATREWTGPAGTQLVEPRILQVLVLLSRHRGEVVSRQALVDACWGGRIVGEDAINRAILKLRRLAHDAGQDSFIVETIPRVGYRLVERSSESRILPAEPVAQPSLFNRRNLLIGAGAGAAIAAAGTGALVWAGRQRSRAADALFARGEAAFQQGARDDNAQAIGFFSQAAGLAPHDGAILGALALALRFEQAFVPPTELDAATRRADLAVARALAVDGRDSDARTARAMYVPFRDHWLETERRMRAGLVEQPDNGVLNGFLGKLLAAVGRTREAIAALDLATHSEQFVPILRQDLVHALFSAGRVGDADRLLDASIGLFPRYAGLWWARFWLYALTGRETAALAHVGNRAIAPTEIGPKETDLATLVTRALDARDSGAITAAMTAVQAYAATTPAFRPQAIGFAATIGRHDAAFDMLDALFAPFDHPQGQRLASTTFLFGAPVAPLRSDPRFAALLHRVRLTDYWSAARTRPDLVVPGLFPGI